MEEDEDRDDDVIEIQANISKLKKEKKKKKDKDKDKEKEKKEEKKTSLLSFDEDAGGEDSSLEYGVSLCQLMGGGGDKDEMWQKWKQKMLAVGRNRTWDDIKTSSKK